MNENPSMMFQVIRSMLYIFDYNQKYEEMNFFIQPCVEFLENQFKSKLLSNQYYSSPILLIQMINYCLINKANCQIKREIVNIKRNEISLIVENKFKLDKVLQFYTNEIKPILKKLNYFLP